MEKKGAINLRNEFGQWRSGKGKSDCIVELRDSLPHYLDDAPDGCAFGFSLHGHTVELHSVLVRDRKNFDRVAESRKEARRRGVEKFFANYVVHKKNFKYLEEVTQLMVSLKVPLFRITKMVSSPAMVENVTTSSKHCASWRSANFVTIANQAPKYLPSTLKPMKFFHAATSLTR
jgi:hypothetical protein